MKFKKLLFTVVMAVAVTLFCAFCFLSFAEEEPVHMHDFSVTEIKPAGVGVKGEIVHSCTGCEEKQTEVIAAVKSVELSKESVSFAPGKAAEVSVTVKDENGNVLVKGTDYTVKYSKNDKPGTATVKVTFKGNYSGSETCKFKIVCSHKYGDWKAVTRATTKDDGEKSRTCTKCAHVDKAKISKIKSVTLAYKSMKYTGKARVNKVTVKNSAGSSLKKDTDYTLKYENNTKFGTATVTVTFKGLYKGTVKKTYKITHDHTYGEWKAVKRATTSKDGTRQRTCSGCGYKESRATSKIKSVTLSKKSVTYTGKEIKVSVTVKNGKDAKLSSKTAYSVKYSENKNVGTATVTVTFKGLYSGKVTKTFKIIPPTTSFERVTPGSKEMLAKWKQKSSQTGGYQIQCAKDKAFSKNVKKFTVKDKNRTGMMIYDLTANNTYYVRIRTFLTKNDKKYYSEWSPVTTAKTKFPRAHYIEGSVPQCDPVSSSYFDDAVFIGDSISLGLTYYEAANDRLGNAQFLTAGSLSARNAQWEVSDASVHPRYNGVKMKLEKSVPLTKAKKIYIMLGMNDIASGVENSYNNFKTLCENIHKAAPYAMFYVESVTPRVNQGSGGNTGALNNRNITLYNNKLSNLCREKGWYFINVAEVMFDSAGYLKREYCSDPNGMGMHFMPAGCSAWVDYLYRHAA